MKKTLRFGIVDVGTNAVRFEIYELIEGLPQRIYQLREVFRLGDTLAHNNRINHAAIGGLLKAFLEFQNITAKAEVVSIRAVGTSVFRQAVDAEQLCLQVLEASGITIEIISGKREAELIVQGILAFEQALPSKCLFVDIGGGSSEISALRNEAVLFSESIPLGAIKAQKQFLKSLPPQAEDNDKLRERIQTLLKEVPWQLLPIETKTAVCSSGTARALTLLAGNSSFSTEWLKSLVKTLYPMDLAQIRAVAGMKEERSDIILAGAILLEEILKQTKIDTIQVSDFSLRHGLLVESIKESTCET